MSASSSYVPSVGSTSPVLSRYTLQDTAKAHSPTPSSTSPSGSPRAVVQDISTLIEVFNLRVKNLENLAEWNDSTLYDINTDFLLISEAAQNMTAGDLYLVLISYNKLMEMFYTQKSRRFISSTKSEVTIGRGIKVGEALSRRVPEVSDEMDASMVVEFSIFFAKSRYEIGKLMDQTMYKLHQRTTIVAEGMTVEQILKILEAFYETSHLGGMGEAVLIDKATQLVALLDISQIQTLLRAIERSMEPSGIRRNYSNGVNEFQIRKLISGVVEQVRTLSGNKNAELIDIFNLLLIFDQCHKISPINDHERVAVLSMLANRMLILLEKMDLEELSRAASSWYLFHAVPFNSIPVMIPGIPFDAVNRLIKGISVRILPNVSELTPLQISQIIPSFTAFEIDVTSRIRMIKALAIETITRIDHFTFRQCSIVLFTLVKSDVKICAVEEAISCLAKKLYELRKPETLESLADAAVSLTFSSLIGPVTKLKAELLERVQSEAYRLNPQIVVKLVKIYANATVNDDHYRAMITELSRLIFLKIKHVNKDAKKDFIVSLIESVSKFTLRTKFCVTIMEELADNIILKVSRGKWSFNYDEKTALISIYRNYDHDSPYFKTLIDILENYECRGQTSMLSSMRR